MSTLTGGCSPSLIGSSAADWNPVWIHRAGFAVAHALKITDRSDIGANEYWMAAQALALGAILVTKNIGEFSRVLGLLVENWLIN